MKAPKPTATRLSLHFAAGPYLKASQLRGLFCSAAPVLMPFAFQTATEMKEQNQSTVITRVSRPWHQDMLDWGFCAGSGQAYGS